MGGYYAFSGIDGCGKTTQSRMLAEWLRARGEDVVQTFEPGSHLNGFNVRNLLLGHQKVSTIALEMLFQSDRAEHTGKVQELLAAGKSVVSDRCYLCGMAYGLACGVSADLLNDLMEISVAVKPDIVFYVDIDPNAARTRLSRGEPLTREESKGTAFAEQVRRNYLLSRRQLSPWLTPAKLVILDGTKSTAEIHAMVTKKIEEG